MWWEVRESSPHHKCMVGRMTDGYECELDTNELILIVDEYRGEYFVEYRWGTTKTRAFGTSCPFLAGLGVHLAGGEHPKIDLIEGIPMKRALPKLEVVLQVLRDGADKMEDLLGQTAMDDESFHPLCEEWIHTARHYAQFLENRHE